MERNLICPPYCEYEPLTVNDANVFATSCLKSIIWPIIEGVEGHTVIMYPVELLISTNDTSSPKCTRVEYITAMISSFVEVLLQGRGGGGQKNLIRGGSAPRSDRLPFYIPFLAETIPISYTLH